MLHRGSDTGAYIVAYSWVWDNVVEVHSCAAGQPALDCPDLDPTNFVEVERSWAGCVWELGVLEHERSAWVRHMLSPDKPDLGGYLYDTVANGPIGQLTATISTSCADRGDLLQSQVPRKGKPVKCRR